MPCECCIQSDTFGPVMIEPFNNRFQSDRRFILLNISGINLPVPEPETPIGPARNPTLSKGELDPSVFCETGLRRFEANGLFFTITGDRQPTFINPQYDEDSFDRFGPSLAQG
jgi:hypothetical protein